ncbi:MAG: hypothetical protein COZ17_07615 [Flavobacteriaceae bacterium CG_4_10_14_3_um_filter_33_47]|nr:MAG: hypothetical protein COW44_13680 [Flavobacteriaceae bacterium CG17_big_fil_post_rev_8_21_14_2_50_33_15]PIY11095.1 MAG: hypothetical protein COZ17_07615 [Flavobacteriaceae bacterium CG_4_10_14_3_um_filter_33_47]PJB17780.1 MAG: hypothetical protein CO117_09980 [Flavobacteriaceae bacterium CG_4_9_14_3_um_filter_33_16]
MYSCNITHQNLQILHNNINPAFLATDFFSKTTIPVKGSKLFKANNILDVRIMGFLNKPLSLPSLLKV